MRKCYYLLVAKFSQLAQLPLTSKEEDIYTSQVEGILEYVEQLSKVDTTGINATYSPVDLENVTRTDEPQVGLSQKEALKNAKEVKNGMFMVTSADKQKSFRT